MGAFIHKIVSIVHQMKQTQTVSKEVQILIFLSEKFTKKRTNVYTKEAAYKWDQSFVFHWIAHSHKRNDKQGINSNVISQVEKIF